MQQKQLTTPSPKPHLSGINKWTMPVLFSLILPLAACSDDSSQAEGVVTTQDTADSSSDAASTNEAPRTDKDEIVPTADEQPQAAAESSTATPSAAASSSATPSAAADKAALAVPAATTEATEDELPELSDDERATLSTDATREAYEQTLPEQIWLSFSGALSNERQYILEPQIAQLGGEPFDPALHHFKPADDIGIRDYLRKGNNAEGPYSIIIKTQALHERQSDAVSPTEIVINLPKGAQAGQSYQVKGQQDAQDDEAQALVSGLEYGWSFKEAAEGVIDVIALDDKISAAWDIHFQDLDEREAQLRGAVRDMPFQPQFEVRGEAKLVDGHRDIAQPAQYQKVDNFLRLNHKNYVFTVDLPLAIEPGTYEAGLITEDQVAISSFMLEPDQLEGEVIITEHGDDFYDVHLEFKALDDDGWGKAVFEYLPKSAFEVEDYQEPSLDPL